LNGVDVRTTNQATIPPMPMASTAVPMQNASEFARLWKNCRSVRILR
jgi:hypothetical protein